MIISSYNKALFTPAAVNSALSQTYGNIEVIVVDDGSTDNSVALLEDFGTRIHLIAKANGGQGSAMNTGFAASSGELILFLDCDDTLDADVVQRIVDVWTPAMAKVHFRLRKIREDGSVVEGKFLPPYKPLSNADVGPILRKYGLYPAPPTSGNAFARAFLGHILPLPEQTYRAWPDTPLIGAAPLFGTVTALDGVGGSFRVSEINYSIGGIDKVEARYACEMAYLRFMREKFADKLPPNFRLRWPAHLKDKLLLSRFSNLATKPGNPSQIALDYIRSVFGWYEYPLSRRVFLSAWAVALAVLPTTLLKRIPNLAGPSLKL